MERKYLTVWINYDTIKMKLKSFFYRITYIFFNKSKYCKHLKRYKVMATAPYKATEIAKWFVNRACLDVDNGGDYMTHLKLQKLLYYAQGCYLALRNKSLFKDKIFAWTYGPVVSTVYDKYKSFAGNAIPQQGAVNIDEDTESVLEEVYQTFGQFSALKLKDMTHSESPWLETKQGNEIPVKKIQEYFVENYIE